METEKLSVKTKNTMYCRQCEYDLRGQTIGRCPECGRAFDPKNPRTYLRRPRRWYTRWSKRALKPILAVVVLLALAWSWFFWGWYSEHRALVAMFGSPLPEFDPHRHNRTHTYQPMILSWLGDRETPGEFSNSDSSWLRDHLGSAGFVLDRVDDLLVPEEATTLAPVAEFSRLEALTYWYGKHVRDLTPLARLKKLVRLRLSESEVADLLPLAGLTELSDLQLDNTPVEDLRPLSGLRKLEDLDLQNTRVTDVAPLAQLESLKSLDLGGTAVANLAPLAGLQNLRVLHLDGTRVADLEPLAGLTSLKDLSLCDGCPVQDLSPLKKIKSLRHLGLWKTQVSPQQVEELRRALPDCYIGYDPNGTDGRGG